jgi:glycyl-tRNA synthetase (class II)
MKLDFDNFFIPDATVIRAYRKAGILVKQSKVRENIASCPSGHIGEYTDWVVVCPNTNREYKMREHFQELVTNVKHEILLDSLTKIRILSSFK